MSNTLTLFKGDAKDGFMSRRHTMIIRNTMSLLLMVAKKSFAAVHGMRKPPMMKKR
jgi:hypothetical protein